MAEEIENEVEYEVKKSKKPLIILVVAIICVKNHHRHPITLSILH